MLELRERQLSPNLEQLRLIRDSEHHDDGAFREDAFGALTGGMRHLGGEDSSGEVIADDDVVAEGTLLDSARWNSEGAVGRRCR